MKQNHEKFGFTIKQWKSFKKEAREILVEVATQQTTITYGQLADKMTTIQVEPHDMMLWHMIGDVAVEEEQAGRGLLSVLVVHKQGDMKPGGGFFELANHFGRDTRDKTKCFVEEMTKVHAVWSIKEAATPRK